ncbi:NUDIX domain-containing protein [Candidatus Woesearchaeota archaeon]|nr:NUDIX domain-containing protein [Candidatus Woesearchaeota archaeon]
MEKTQCAGGVVLNSKGLVLVVTNRQRKSWSLPKGHIDTGEDALTAAKREIYEESGVKQLKLIKALGSYQRHRTALDGGDDTSELKTLHIYLFTTKQEKLAPLDPHNPEARWVEKERVAELLTHRKDKEFFSKVMEEL